MLSRFWSKPSRSVAAGEQPNLGKREITFAVDSVTPAPKPIWTETLADSLARRFQRKILALPQEQMQVTNTAFDSLSDRVRAQLNIRDIGSRCHPLIEAVHVAFSQHRPLSLSPDAIWLVIAQGFGHHVAENAETLRGRLVRHTGRRELVAETQDLSLASFEQAITGFSSQIQQATDPVLYETLVCDFSTTAPGIRTASEVALMDTFASYFEYHLWCVCGIPQITIDGTPEDWQRIRSRVEVLATYDLEWWVSRLRPILDEFVMAATGHPTREFWQAIYKPAKAYGDEVVTGWITDLFPYLGDAPDRRRNHALEYDRHEWALPVDKGIETKNHVFNPLSGKGVGLKAFPSGLSSAPVKVLCRGGSRTDVDLVAGFFALQQNLSDLTLSPVIGWCVTEPVPKTPVMIW
jgi:hypothetical protein